MTISHPSNGETRKIDTDIPFIGTAADVEDGELPSPEWQSDLEGTLGSGPSITVPLTMAGVHTITLTASDSDGNVDVASITLTLEP